MAKRIHPPIDDRPEDCPVAWFASMCLARERGDSHGESVARHELERLGWSIRLMEARQQAPGREGGR